MPHPGRTCTVCAHAQRAAIDAALVAPAVSIRGISRQYGVGDDSLYRHAGSHLPAHLAKAADAAEASNADKLLAYVRALHSKAVGLLLAAEKAGDLRTALAGIREARGCLELLARLQGELQEGATVNVLLAPEWVTLRTALLHALVPFPEARVRVVEALAAVEEIP